MLENITDAQAWQQTDDRVRAHYSSLTLHRKCPQAWYYRYELELQQDREEIAAPERDFGSWVGAWQAAESLERGRKFDSLKSARSFRSVDGIDKFKGETVTRGEVEEAAAAWWSHQSDEARAVWNDRLGGDLPDLLATATSRWMDEWAHERKHERPIANELFWERNLPKPPSDAEWDAQANGLSMTLIGFIDELYWDTQREIVVARDRKTSKGLSTQTAIDDMMDSQLALYAWGVGPWLAQKELPQVRGLGYDRMRSIQPKPPQLTLAGKLAVRGGEPSLSSTDLQTYLEWAKGPDGEGVPWGEEGAYFVSGPRKGAPKFGRYTAEEKVIQALSMPAARSVWFQRSLDPVSPHVQRAHLRAAVDTATDIWRTQKRAERAGEAARNISQSNCRWCDYASLCRAQMIGGPSGEYELLEHSLKTRDGRRTLELAQ